MESFFVYLQKSPYNMMVFGGALASGALLLWPLLMRPFRAGSEVTAFAAVQLINRKQRIHRGGESGRRHRCLGAGRHAAAKKITVRMR